MDSFISSAQPTEARRLLLLDACDREDGEMSSTRCVNAGLHGRLPSTHGTVSIGGRSVRKPRGEGGSGEERWDKLPEVVEAASEMQLLSTPLLDVFTGRTSQAGEGSILAVPFCRCGGRRCASKAANITCCRGDCPGTAGTVVATVGSTGMLVGPRRIKLRGGAVTPDRSRDTALASTPSVGAGNTGLACC